MNDDMRGATTATNDASGAAVTGARCALRMTPEQAEHRGMAWLIGSFLICPCHLPLTLWVAGVVLGGTALGAALRSHPIIAGTVITLAWVAGTWRGLHLLRSGGAYAAEAKERRAYGRRPNHQVPSGGV